MRRIKLIRSIPLSLALVLVLGSPTFAAPQAAPAFKDTTAMPDGRVGERIRSLIEALNAADPAAVRRFLEEECTAELRASVPIERRIASVLNFGAITGGVDFYAIRTYTPDRPDDTVAIVKDRSMESPWALTLRFGPEPDLLITGLGFDGARPPDLPPGPPLGMAEAMNEIRSLLAGLKTKGWLSGSVLVARGADILLTDAGGEASKAFHVPNNVDTKFNLGSMNKMFTTVAAARLIEAGKIAFDDPISKWVDETWLPKDVTDRITIRHLMTHTSGLGSYFNETYMKSSRDLFRKLDDYKPLIKDDRPAFQPGERFQYSNTGMFLLGVVIEKVTGEDYFEHIRKAVYEPAGMMDTDCYEMDRPVENLAIGYSPDFSSPYKWRNNLYQHTLKGGPAGGGFSTVRDLHRFAVALLSGTYVSEATLETLWTDVKGESYGYGFAVEQGSDGKVVGHSGGFPGINSQLDIHLGSGYIVAVMSNHGGGASPLAEKIGRILARVPEARQGIE